jgi:hypothetical protein
MVHCTIGYYVVMNLTEHDVNHSRRARSAELLLVFLTPRVAECDNQNFRGKINPLTLPVAAMLG